MPSFADLVFAESRARTAGFRNGYRCGYRSACEDSYADNIAATAAREAANEREIEEAAARLPGPSRSELRRLAIMQTGRLPL